MSQTRDKIPVFEVIEATVGPVTREGVTRGPEIARMTGGAGHAVKAVEYSVDVMRDNMTLFVDAINNMIGECSELKGGFSMDSVEVNAHIGAGGTIGFMGTGMNLEGSASLTIVLRRKGGDGVS